MAPLLAMPAENGQPANLPLMGKSALVFDGDSLPANLRSDGHSATKRIMVVDDEKQYRNLVGGLLQTFGYSFKTAADAAEAMESLQREHFDLVISDIRMPNKDGVQFMKEAKSIFTQLDFIMMTGHAAEYTYTEIISAGAVDFIAKPFEIGELEAKLKRIERERQAFNQLRSILVQTIEALTTALETRDPYTVGHQRRVAQLASAIAREMNISSAVATTVHMAGLVHDIGKISIPSEILTKPSRLRGTEMSLIKDHPQLGFEVLKGIQFPWPIAQIELQHHERMDGSGYPQGLSGKDIFLEARIIAVADVVEAMMSHRPYRPAVGIEAALDEISKNKGTLYDPEAVDACLRLFREKDYRFGL